MKAVTLFWFRRDLRLHDNAALFYALKHHKNVLPVFVFDTKILDKLDNKADRRVDFIYQVLKDVKQQLNALGSDLLVLKGIPVKVFGQLQQKYSIDAVYANHDYEPDAIVRDEEIRSLLKLRKTQFYTYKDQVIFEGGEVTKDDGLPYTVFTPYSKKWKAKLDLFYVQEYPSSKYFDNFYQTKATPLLSLKEIGFEKTNVIYSAPFIDEKVIAQYHQTRDFPAIDGTTKLSVHLRFGTVSIRRLVQTAFKNNETLLNELIWRDFYTCILYHFPQVTEGAFKTQYNFITWRNNVDEFTAWCNGQTGYPIVDAGMRELNETGFMHNRVRMIVASFLTKHLLIDWRWGEACFAEKLLDFDLAANNGGWQWAAGSGCDAVPYFRIFNPYEQTKKFDKDLKYIRKWIPEFEEFNYPKPIVEHKFARERALAVYKKALQQ